MKRIKRTLALVLACLLLASGTGCAGPEKGPALDIQPEIAQMRAICELAVMECYYHNVAKFMDEDAAGILWWTKGKHFWIEYSSIVRLGIDVSLVDVKVEGDRVTITIPEAKVLSCQVDSASLTEDSFYLDKNSASIEAADEVAAFAEAQRKVEETASADRALLLGARQRAQALLEEYVNNVGRAMGKEYAVDWVILDREEAPAPAASAPAETASPAAETPA